MSRPPLRARSLISSQIWPSDRPSHAIDSGARCHSGWPGTWAGSKLAPPWQVLQGSVGAPWSVQATAKYIYSGDGTGKIYRLDKNTGKLLGWVQTGMAQGQTGCIIHELWAVSDNVLIRGSCSEWNVTKITFKN